MTPFRPEAACPLDGIRVLDLSRLVAGNMLSLQLADFGAEVIKVEDPGKGDPLRALAHPGPLAVYWKVYARNKKSLTLDLRKPRARSCCCRWSTRAHVLIENYRPGTLEEMGLGPDVLHAMQPAAWSSCASPAGDRTDPTRQARLRHAGRRHVRLRRQERLCRPRARAAADCARRHGGRALRRQRRA